MDATKYADWNRINRDFKVVTEDGRRMVLVWDEKVGTVLVPWIGPEG
jgi:hypothetical protein